MKVLIKRLFILFLLLVTIISLTGCQAWVKQVDNKIYTNINYDLVYNFVLKALDNDDYRIMARSREDGIIKTVPGSGNELFFGIEEAEVNVTVLEKDDKKEVVVEVEAIVYGNYDKEKSLEIVKNAVMEMLGKIEDAKNDPAFKTKINDQLITLKSSPNQLAGEAGAVETGARVFVYEDFLLAVKLVDGMSNADGSFSFELADYDGSGVFVQAELANEKLPSVLIPIYR
jgi:hypothetical protein